MAVVEHHGVPTTAEIGSPDAGYPDQWAYYEQLRELGDVVWDDFSHTFLVTSFELCRQLTPGELWDPYPIQGAGQPLPGGLDDETWMQLWSLGSPRVGPLGPQGVEQHRWWFSLFTPRVMMAWRNELIRPICHAQIDRIAEEGRAELVADYAARIAPRVFVRLMGVDTDDAYVEHLADLFVRRYKAAEQVFAVSRDLDQTAIDVALAANDALREELTDLVLSRRDGRGDDLISAAWRDADRAFGAGWEENDIIAFAAVLWDAGSTTTIFSTANGIHLLLTEPDVREQVRRQPALLSSLIEESLRLYGTAPMNRTRIARKDFEFAGVQIQAGDLFRGVIAAGNRDPRHYPRPDEVDLDRSNSRDHLSFGTGTRSCAGQAIARAELEESLAVLLDRLPDVELDPDAEPPHFGHGIILRLWKPLHVRWAADPSS
jgi:cytochrome P450